MIPPPRSDLRLGHGTHPGETGKNNEDRYAVMVFRAEPETGEIVTLAVLADGIGGHRAGEVAADLAVRTISEAVGQSADRDYCAVLERAFAQAARAIVERARSRPEYREMGSTCTAALMAGRRLYLAYAGDSRVYLLRGGAFRQVSVDHTWVQEALEAGILTREEARQHPNRHVLRRHLGHSPDVKPDFRLRLAEGETAEQSEKNQGLTLRPGDAVLVCSDGLSDLVEEAEIRTALTGRKPQAAVDKLILLARGRGGLDNITVIVMQVPPE